MWSETLPGLRVRRAKRAVSKDFQLRSLLRQLAELSPAVLAKLVPGVVALSTTFAATRVLSMAELGLFTTALATATMVMTIAAGPSDAAMVRFAAEYGRPAYRFYGWASAAASVALAAVAFRLSLGRAAGATLWGVTTATAGLLALLHVRLSWERGQNRWAEFVRSSLKFGAWRLTMLTIVVLVPPARTASGIVSSIGGAAVLTNVRHIRALRPGDITAMSKTLRFSLTVGAASAAIAFLSHTGRLALPRFASLEDVGTYGVAYVVVEYSVGASCSVAAIAFYPRLVRELKLADGVGLRRRFRDNLVVVTLIASVVSVCVILGSPALIPLLLPGSVDSRDVAAVVTLLSLGISLHAIAELALFSYHLSLESRSVVKATFGAAVVHLTALLAALPMLGLLGAALATAIGYGVLLLLSLVRPLKYGVRRRGFFVSASAQIVVACLAYWATIQVAR